MKYIALTLTLLSACAAYPDDCYVHVYVPCEADAGTEDDAGQELFEPEESRGVSVGRGVYVGPGAK